MIEARIYVLVAETVQNHLLTDGWCGKCHKVPVLKAGPNTQTIVQPAGRLAAQAAHVVARMRMRRLVRQVQQNPKNIGALQSMSDEAITTIILGVPDSFQLSFFEQLLKKQKIDVTQFWDDNEDYGPHPLKTAICTEPVLKSDVRGILDYVPLWS